MAYTIGLTGGIASGKSLATKILNEKGCEIIFADDEAKSLYSLNSPTYQAIHKRYGDEILTHSLEINKTLLKEIIFNNENEKKWLESQTHPKVITQIKQKIHASISKIIVIESAILFETNLDKICNEVIFIETTKNIQVQRALQRDKTSKDIINNIIQMQNDHSTKSNYIIQNNKDLNSFRKSICKVYKSICKKIE